MPHQGSTLIQAVLPPHCQRPLRVAPALDDAQRQAARGALNSLRQAQRGVAQDMVDHRQLETLLGRAAACVAGLQQALPSGVLDRPSSPQSQRIVLDCCKERESPAMLEQYRVYDEHFGLVRVHELNPVDLAGQTARTFGHVLADLPGTLLGRGVYEGLLTGMLASLELLVCDPESPGEPILADPEVLEGQPALLRWRHGHHCFGLMCYFGRECLARAIDTLGEPIQAAEWVQQAGTFLAASTAAMVYAADLPRGIYVDEIRKQMPESLSGSQNADFNHFKLLKGQLHKALLQRHETCPPPLQSALLRYRALDLLDLDWHVVLAAEKIGFAPSLKQQAHDPSGLSALEALRHMAEARKADFQGI